LDGHCPTGLAGLYFMKNKMAVIKLGPLVEGHNHMPENMALAGVIRRHRDRLGLSQNQLADESGFSRQTLGNIESDTYLAGLDVLGLIARRIGTSSGRLLMEAERWVAQLPSPCRACKYACMARGRLKWLSAHRQCTRLPKAPPAPAATYLRLLPVAGMVPSTS
jgi:DNA-binding XRE family transcriptional regulator